jgi:hypothetical protein
MGLTTLPRSLEATAHTRARSLAGGRWSTVATDAHAAAGRVRRQTWTAYVGLALTLGVALQWLGPVIVERYPGVPGVDALAVFAVGAVWVLVLKWYERTHARDRLLAMLWTALRWACVPPDYASAARVEPEVAGRLAYASALARTQLAGSVGSSAYGGVGGPRRKAAYLALQLRELAEWPFRHASGRPSQDWRRDLSRELVDWITAVHDGTWYRKVPDSSHAPFDDAVDMRAAGVVLSFCVAVGGVVLETYGPVGDGAAELAAVLAVLLLVGRPVVWAFEGVFVAARGLPRWVLGR